MQYKVRLLVDKTSRNIYRDTLAGAYEGANKVLISLDCPAARAEVFERVGSKDWRRVDRQEVSAGSLLKC